MFKTEINKWNTVKVQEWIQFSILAVEKNNCKAHALCIRIFCEYLPYLYSSLSARLI